MKLGYLPTEALSMYRSLAREASEFWGWGFIPKFGIHAEKKYGIPHMAMASTNFNPNDFSELLGIRFNSFYLPYLYEDELIVTLLHELAHVQAGIEAQHGQVWQAHAEEIGAVPEAKFVLRRLWDDAIPWLTLFDKDKERLGQPTLGFI